MQAIVLPVRDINNFLTFSVVREKGPRLKNPSPIGWSGMEEYHMALHNMERYTKAAHTAVRSTRVYRDLARMG